MNSPLNITPRPFRLVLLAVAVLATALTGCSTGGGDAAVVNGVSISREAYTSKVGENLGNPEAEQRVIEQLVLFELVEQGLVEAGGELPSDADVEAAVAETEEAMGEQFQAALDANGLTREDAVQQERINQIITELNRVKTEDVVITDEEIEAANPPLIAHVLVETEVEAADVFDRLSGGEAIADVAADVSLDPGSAANGGIVGALQPGMFVPEFEQAAMLLDVGEISEPVETQFGWHVLTIIQRELTEEEREQVAEQLRASNFNIDQFVAEQVRDADVTIASDIATWAPEFQDNMLVKLSELPLPPLGELIPNPDMPAPELPLEQEGVPVDGDVQNAPAPAEETGGE